MLGRDLSAVIHTEKTIVGEGSTIWNGTPLSCAASALRQVPSLLQTVPLAVTWSVPVMTLAVRRHAENRRLASRLATDNDPS